MREVIALRERRRFQPVKAALYEVARVIGGGARNPAIDVSILQGLSAEELSHRAVHRAAGEALFQFLRKNHSTADWRSFVDLAQLACGHPLDSPVRILFGYMAATRALAGLVTLESMSLGSSQAHLPAMHSALDAAQAAYPAAFSYTFHRAALASFSNRSEAARLFAQAKCEAPLTVEEMPFQVGMHTYFSDADIPHGGYPTEADLRLFKQSFPHQRDIKGTLLLSVDERYLRLFGPYWFHVAPVLANARYRLVFLVVGQDPSAAISEASAVAASISGFRGSSHANVELVPIKTPPFVQNHRTFAATARFLFIRTILEQTGAAVIITDADMILSGSLDQMAGLGDGLGVMASAGKLGLLPWRRYVASTVYFGVATCPILDGLQRYIVHGLSKKQSWTLDQNALTYAVEKAEGNVPIQNIALMRRPIAVDGLAPMLKARRRLQYR